MFYWVLLLCFFRRSFTADIKGRIVLPDGLDASKLEHDLSGIKCSLYPTREVTYSKMDNSFSFTNVEDGTYLLEIDHQWFKFANLKIEIEDGSVEALNVDSKKKNFQGRHSSLLIEPVGLIQYFQKRQKMSFFFILKNPMVLLSLVSFGLMFLMPKLTAGMDPEELKKLQEEQRKNQANAPDASKMWNELMGKKNEDSDSDSD
eukprot:snap_masked-scaffold_7-processed-gene-11.35-mRNA-1 protein AED:1.00 eAED:1.00 QI:0/-1/0/0/-1/1/1/0/202